MTCLCDSIGAPAKIRFCAEHHRYWFGDKHLTSLSKVFRDVWPIRKSWDGVDEAVIANARERGVDVDTLFSAWVVGKLDPDNPPPAREDSRERFVALASFWKCVDYDALETQAIVHDDELAGTIDLVSESIKWDHAIHLWDLKNTANLESEHSLKLAAYAELYEKQHGVTVAGIGDIQVTQKKGERVKVRLVEYDLMIARNEWRIVREFWTLAQRYQKKGLK